MKLSDMKSHGDVQRARCADDPAYAALSDRLALADAVSVAVVHYRAEHGLSQSALAAQIGWKQPHVARLERGDVSPSLQSLERLARAGVIEVHIEQAGTRIAQGSPRQGCDEVHDEVSAMTPSTERATP